MADTTLPPPLPDFLTQADANPTLLRDPARPSCPRVPKKETTP